MNEQLTLPLPDVAPGFYRVETTRDDEVLDLSPLFDDPDDADDYRRHIVHGFNWVSWEPQPRSSGWVGLATDGERGHVYRSAITQRRTDGNEDRSAGA